QEHAFRRSEEAQSRSRGKSMAGEGEEDVKLCMDCEHCYWPRIFVESDQINIFAMCNAPPYRNDRSPVVGFLPNKPCREARADEVCGPDAKRFEPQRRPPTP